MIASEVEVEQEKCIGMQNTPKMATLISNKESFLILEEKELIPVF
jgi:hypothetical protein